LPNSTLTSLLSPLATARSSGLPAFENSDGLVLTEHLEMQWSDGASGTVKAYAPETVSDSALEAACGLHNLRTENRPRGRKS
jgi:hypothetical protein